MDKLEMAKKLYELSDKEGRVKLEDFANLVFDKNSPQDVLDNFLKHADQLAEAENLWNEVGKIGKSISDKQSELESLQTEFNAKYDRLKLVSKELGMDKYINLP